MTRINRAISVTDRGQPGRQVEPSDKIYVYIAQVFTEYYINSSSEIIYIFHFKKINLKATGNQSFYGLFL